MRRTHVVALLLALALGLLAAGCLDGTETTATADTVVGEVPQSTTARRRPTRPEADRRRGRRQGRLHGPGLRVSCHTLAAAGSAGTVGPNLDEAKPDTELIVTRVTKGASPMPAFGETLTPQQIADVAAYVKQSTGG